jgi:uncharacterized protein YndB with AHSA1/START domain
MNIHLLLVALAIAPSVMAKTLVVEGVIDAPPAVAWNLFTSKEGMETWLAPHVEIDLRVGGAMRVHYDPNGTIGDPKTITNTILAFDPERMFAIKATGLPEGFPYPKAIESMWTVLYFEPLWRGRTRLRIVSLGIGDDPDGQALYRFFERGNRITVERLQKRARELRARQDP